MSCPPRSIIISSSLDGVNIYLFLLPLNIVPPPRKRRGGGIYCGDGDQSMPRISAFGMAGSSIARNDSISSRVKAAQPPEITSPESLNA